MYLDCVSPAGRVSRKSTLNLDYINLWTPPPSGTIKINFDASWSSDEGAGFGFLIRNHAGTPVMAGARHSCVASSFLAEVLAASWAIEVATTQLENRHIHSRRRLH